MPTSRWLAGGSFYPEHQLAGPYPITDGDILYPPTTIPLFMAFLVLPRFLFWAIPLAVVAWAVVRDRPAPWTWPLMALCLAYIPTMVKIVHFNPFIWAAAAIALGTHLRLAVAPRPYQAVARAVRGRGHQPSLVVDRARDPHRLRAVFGADVERLPDRADRTRITTVGLLYSLSDVPLLLIPLIAYLGRTRRIASERRLSDRLQPNSRRRRKYSVRGRSSVTSGPGTCQRLCASAPLTHVWRLITSTQASTVFAGES